MTSNVGANIIRHVGAKFTSPHTVGVDFIRPKKVGAKHCEPEKCRGEGLPSPFGGNMNYIENLINRKPHLKSQEQNIKTACDTLVNCYKNGNKVLICGNGGSSADSAHIVGELMKGFKKQRKIDDSLKNSINNVLTDLSKNTNIDPDKKLNEFVSTIEVGLATIDLTSFQALNTAIANDTNSEYVFANSVNALGKAGDALIAISTSGNSKNVVDACIMAKAKNINVIALVGGTGGLLKNLSDIMIASPDTECYLVQEDHISIYHALCLQIEEELF